MRLFLQFSIGDWQEDGYVKPLLSFATSLADDMLGADIDNHSEEMVVRTIRQLIDQANSIFVFANAADPKQPMNGILSLVNDLFQNKEKIHLAVLAGEHPALEKLLRILDDKFIKNNEEELIKKMIKQYARS